MSSPAAVPSARVQQLLGHLTAAGSSPSAATAPVTIVSRQQGVAVIQINNPPVNSLSPAVQQGIADCYEDAVSDDSIKAVVIVGNKANFMGRRTGAASAGLEGEHERRRSSRAPEKIIRSGARPAAAAQ
jgi:hypothetical protein